MPHTMEVNVMYRKLSFLLIFFNGINCSVYSKKQQVLCAKQIVRVVHFPFSGLDDFFSVLCKRNNLMKSLFRFQSKLGQLPGHRIQM